jgi:catechol 2,3-dioxygenase-like lactoylglutathione lyase family enzyme
MRYRHLAIFVPELRSAEAYYREVFNLDVIVREAPPPGRRFNEWGQLPLDKGWVDAEAAGIEIGMVGLGRDDFVLALFPGEPSPGQVYAIGVVVNEAEIAEGDVTFTR